MKNTLEIKNLNLHIGEYQVLHNVNLVLKQGTMTSLVGESGCGKTMTAMSVMRLLPKGAKITSGEIIFDGQNLLEHSEKQMRELRGNKIVLIPQDPMTSLNPLYTVGNQLSEAIRAHSKVSHHQAIRKAKEVMDLVKIPDTECKLNYYPHEFSGGMKQRIIIAMALASNPELIIADEPTTALDVTIQKQIMDLIDELRKELNTTVLLISHDLALVSNYTDNISVMYAGSIIEEASRQNFFRQPLHPYSKALLDSLPQKNPYIKLKIISGAPPSIQENVSGCKFHPRCEMCRKDICTQSSPELKQVLPEHYSACFLNI